MTREEQIKKNMKCYDLTYEEAVQLYEDDKADYIGEEGEKLEEKAKKNNPRHYEVNVAKKRKKTEKVKKVDEEKKAIIAEVDKLLQQLGMANITLKTETEINFTTPDGSDMTFKLTRHRKK